MEESENEEDRLLKSMSIGDLAPVTLVYKCWS